MMIIRVVPGGYQLVEGGKTFRKIHEAMTNAEQICERYGKVIEWAKDPASGEYVGFTSAKREAVTL